MSYVKLERRPISWWRVRANSIGQMIDQGWVVWSVCNRCLLVLPADLEWLAWKLGDGETLWNRHPSCRRFGCEGVITFHGTPPETNRCMELKADWPKEWQGETPSIPPRLAPEKRAEPLADPKTPEAAKRPWAR
ncbi:hypothetical protein [Brevundimonas goettingensis]|uniref:Uncharacterized protein n=1 Tax=Brevundimonas goettingensis TaxID=2774190 RepID=A0A975BYW5_9CAUL|nr:hypothetical protein [Brevundimonas goettingensis]QTC90468.1 hypothetical protein IFJ75_14455 [Brevundimonas goettingensis]